MLGRTFMKKIGIILFFTAAQQLSAMQGAYLLAGNAEAARQVYYDRIRDKFGTLAKSEYNKQTGVTTHSYIMAERKPKPQSANHEYKTLHDAAKADDIIGMRKFIAQGCDINALNEEDGDTPLHCAVDYRSLNALELLAQMKANLQALDKKGEFTPAHLVDYSRVNEGERRPFEICIKYYETH